MGEKKIDNLTGIVTVLNTPFARDGSVDHRGLDLHVRCALEAGVDGFLVPAMASEVGFLSREERLEVTRTVVEAADGEVPVIGGASADPQERAGIIRELLAVGCDGILAAVTGSDSGNCLEEIRRIADGGMEYLMIQDWDASGYGIPVETIVRAVEEIPAFRALKIEVVPAGVKYTQVLAATGKRLKVAGGWAVMHLIDGLDRGVDIFMPTAMHELYVGLLRLYRGGRRDEAVRWFRRLLPILTFSNQHLEVSICFFKRLVMRQGIYLTDLVRCPTRFWDWRNIMLSDVYIDEVLALIEEMNLAGIG